MRSAIESLLRESGWRPGRSQEVSAVLVRLESLGYSVCKPVELFLREFSGISIHFTRNGRTDVVSFDAQRASIMADPEWLAHYGECAGTRLVPIGYSNHEHLLLMESDEGGFYGAYGDYLCALGAEPDEMIEHLVYQDREPRA